MIKESLTNYGLFTELTAYKQKIDTFLDYGIFKELVVDQSLENVEQASTIHSISDSHKKIREKLVNELKVDL